MSIAALRAKLFAAAVKKETFTYEPLDLTVEIRGMTAGARARVMTASRTEDGTVDFGQYYPALLIESVFDAASGEPMFSAGDAEAISALPADVVEAFAAVAQRVSGLGAAEETIEKNSDSIPSDATSSTSPNA